jgi:hypothetical protein
MEESKVSVSPQVDVITRIRYSREIDAAVTRQGREASYSARAVSDADVNKKFYRKEEKQKERRR